MWNQINWAANRNHPIEVLHLFRCSTHTITHASLPRGCFLATAKLLAKLLSRSWSRMRRRRKIKRQGEEQHLNYPGGSERLRQEVQNVINVCTRLVSWYPIVRNFLLLIQSHANCWGGTLLWDFFPDEIFFQIFFHFFQMLYFLKKIFFLIIYVY